MNFYVTTVDILPIVVTDAVMKLAITAQSVLAIVVK
jgi:hypothetical protein